VLRKLKTPKFEQVHTVRTAQDRKRFAKIANAVLNGIDAGIYMPQPNWMCADCSLRRRLPGLVVRRKSPSPSPVFPLYRIFIVQSPNPRQPCVCRWTMVFHMIVSIHGPR
jgi:hypothetical protein